MGLFFNWNRMGIWDYLREDLDRRRQEHRLRKTICIDTAQGPVVRMTADGSEKVLFCSNNYLNLAEDPQIQAAVREAIDRYGVGSAASRLISGTMAPHAKLERRFAEWVHSEAALFFSCGWMANQAVLQTLPQKGDLVLIDRLDHASILDAVEAGDARFKSYRHNDLNRLGALLAEPGYNRRFIVTESVFSMDGDTADLARLVGLKKQYGAILIVDEAHSIGCMGPTGVGLAEQMGVLDQIDILVAPLGKAFGCGGAMVAGPQVVIDTLVNCARPFIFTTAPSPLIASAALAALEIIRSQPQRREQLAANARYLRDRLVGAGFDIGPSSTHIIPLMIGPSDAVVRLSEKLFAQGYFVAAIRPPTVPPNTARLRISLQANHTQKQMDGLLSVLMEWKQSSRIISGEPSAAEGVWSAEIPPAE
jgi:8-amino-7-oxononanoate synthase